MSVIDVPQKKWSKIINITKNRCEDQGFYMRQVKTKENESYKIRRNIARNKMQWFITDFIGCMHSNFLVKKLRFYAQFKFIKIQNLCYNILIDFFYVITFFNRLSKIKFKQFFVQKLDLIILCYENDAPEYFFSYLGSYK